MTETEKELAAAYDEANMAHRVACNNEQITMVYRRAWRHVGELMKEVGAFHPEYPDTYPERLHLLEEYEKSKSRGAQPND